MYKEYICFNVKVHWRENISRDSNWVGFSEILQIILII